MPDLEQCVVASKPAIKTQMAESTTRSHDRVKILVVNEIRRGISRKTQKLKSSETDKA